MQLKYRRKYFQVNSFNLFPDRVKIWVWTEILPKIAAVVLKAENDAHEAGKT